jgi:hypothetical protein
MIWTDDADDALRELNEPRVILQVEELALDDLRRVGFGGPTD